LQIDVLGTRDKRRTTYPAEPYTVHPGECDSQSRLPADSRHSTRAVGRSALWHVPHAQPGRSGGTTSESERAAFFSFARRAQDAGTGGLAGKLPSEDPAGVRSKRVGMSVVGERCGPHDRYVPANRLVV
jgi:hypothetical protein